MFHKLQTVMFDLFGTKKKKSPAKRKTTAKRKPATKRKSTGLSGTPKRKTTRKTSATTANQQRGAAMFKKIHARAKKIRKSGEDYNKAVKRASSELKREGAL